MASSMAWTKKCRTCGKEKHAGVYFRKQRPAPGQLPICLECEEDERQRNRERLEEENWRNDHGDLENASTN